MSHRDLEGDQDGGTAGRFGFYAGLGFTAVGDAGMANHHTPIVLASAALTMSLLASVPPDGPDGVPAEGATHEDFYAYALEQRADIIASARTRTATERSEALAFVTYLRILVDAAAAALHDSKEGDTDDAWLAATAARNAIREARAGTPLTPPGEWAPSGRR